MSKKGLSRAKIQQFIGLFAGLAVFVVLLTIALVTRPGADVNDIGQTVYAWGPIQSITNSDGQKIGKARLALLNKPIAGQDVKVALVAENSKNWALKNGSRNVSLASLWDIYHTEYKKTITEGDKNKMVAANANQFNGFTLANLPKPTAKAGGSAITLPATNNWAVPNTQGFSSTTTAPLDPTAITKIKATLAKWINNNITACKTIDLSESSVTSAEALKTIIRLQGLDANSVYCADSSQRVVSNLDLYAYGQSEEFVYIKSEEVKTSALQNWTHKEIIRHAPLADVLKYTIIPPSDSVKNPYIAFPYNPISKTALQDVEIAKLNSNANSTSLSVLPEGKVVTEFTIPVPSTNTTVNDYKLDISIPLKYTVPNQTAKGVQNIGDPFVLRGKTTKTSLQAQYPYYLDYCYESFSIGMTMYLCNSKVTNQNYITDGEWCTTSGLTPGVITCPSGKKYRSHDQVDPKNANVYAVDINYINRLDAAKNFSVAKQTDLLLSYPITIPQVLKTVNITVVPSTTFNSGDSVSATSKLLDQFGAEYINRVGLTYKWEAIEGASNITINNATGPEATIIGKNTRTAEVTSKVNLIVTSGTTVVSSAPVTLTIKNLPPNESFTSVIVTPSSATMNNGEEKTFTAIAQDSAGRAVTSGISYQWTIGDATVITSSGSTTSSTVKVIAKNLTSTKTSSLTVKATDANNFSHNGNSSITVNAKPQTTTTTTGGGVVIPVITMAISPSSLALVSGNSGKLTATASINGVPNTSNEISYDWKSDKQTVAEVIGSGREVNIKANSVTTQTFATITLTASYRGISRSGTVGVTVIPASPPPASTTTATPTIPPTPSILSSVDISPAGSTMNPIIVEKLANQSFSAQSKDQRGANYSNVEYSWSSTDSPINILLTSNGNTANVTAKAIGTTSKIMVVVTDKVNIANKITKEIYVKIPKRLTTITVSETTNPLTNGILTKDQTATYKVIAKDQDGGTMNGTAGLTYIWSTNTNLTLTNPTTDTVTVKANTVDTTNTLSLTVSYEGASGISTGQPNQSPSPIIKVLQTISSVGMLENKTSAVINKDGTTNFTIIAYDENTNQILPKSTSNPLGATFNFTPTDGASSIKVDRISENEIKVTMLGWNKTSKIATNATYNNKTIPSQQSPQLTVTSPRQIGSALVNDIGVVLGNTAEITTSAKDTDSNPLVDNLSYDWTILDNNTNISFVGATNTNKVTIKGEKLGTAKVQVKVTYNITESYVYAVSNVGITSSATTTTTTVPGATTTTTTPSTTTTTTTITPTTAPDQAGPDINGQNTTYNYPTSSIFTSLVKNIPLKKGWNMLSLAYEATPINSAISRFTGLFRIDETIYLPHMYWYKNSINSYEDQYASSSPVGLGASSFILSEKDRVADVSDNVSRIQTLSTTQAHAFEIPLNASAWTMVGNPYSTAISYDDSHIFVKIGNRIATISDAISEAYITQAYAINSATSNYISLVPGDTLAKYQGFWIKTNQPDTKLLIAPVSLTPAN